MISMLKRELFGTEEFSLILLMKRLNYVFEGTSHKQTVT